MFHEKQEHNKNILRLETFKKTTTKNIQPHQNFTGSYKKAQMYWMNSKIQIISKGKGKQIVAQNIQPRLA